MPTGRERRSPEHIPAINIPLTQWGSSPTLRSARYLLTLLLFLTGSAETARGQGQRDYDEISVYVSVQSVGGLETPALIKNNLAYLSITDIFNFLKIKNGSSASLDSITGFFISPDVPFVIDKSRN